jgi:hypothetical protein
MSQKDEKKDETAPDVEDAGVLKHVIQIQWDNIRLREELDALRKKFHSTRLALREKTALLDLILEKDRRHEERQEENMYALEQFASHVNRQTATLANGEHVELENEDEHVELENEDEHVELEHEHVELEHEHVELEDEDAPLVTLYLKTAGGGRR